MGEISGEIEAIEKEVHSLNQRKQDLLGELCALENEDVRQKFDQQLKQKYEDGIRKKLLAEMGAEIEFAEAYNFFGQGETTVWTLKGDSLHRRLLPGEVTVYQKHFRPHMYVSEKTRYEFWPV